MKNEIETKKVGTGWYKLTLNGVTADCQDLSQFSGTEYTKNLKWRVEMPHGNETCTTLADCKLVFKQNWGV